MVQLTPHGPPEERKQRGGRSTSVPGLGSVSKKQDQNSSKGTERERERKKNESFSFPAISFSGDDVISMWSLETIYSPVGVLLGCP